MNRAGKGIACENRVAAYLEERGWIVGLRRHRKGGGDLLANKPGYRPRLYECKASPTDNPWENFRPAERTELLATAERFEADAFLALSPSKQVSIIPSKDFPR